MQEAEPMSVIRLVVSGGSDECVCVLEEDDVFLAVLCGHLVWRGHTHWDLCLRAGPESGLLLRREVKSPGALGMVNGEAGVLH